jgi:hypothetical protein
MAPHPRPLPPRSPHPVSSEQLAAAVRRHLDQRTLSHPHADLDLAALARRVRELSGELETALIDQLGANHGQATHRALFVGEPDGSETPALWSILKHAGLSAFAAQTLGLRTLSERARRDLDELIERRSRIEAVSTRSRLIKELLDAEEREDTNAFKQLASELDRECPGEQNLTRSLLARARRDRIRLAQLTTPTPSTSPASASRRLRGRWRARLAKARRR